MCAYLVLLRVEITRFTSCKACAPHELVSAALILTSRWTAVSCYAALRSPDLPPVPCFHACTGGGLVSFTFWIIRCYVLSLSVKARTPQVRGVAAALWPIAHSPRPAAPGTHQQAD